jgi:hypothetical protein
LIGSLSTERPGSARASSTALVKNRRRIMRYSLVEKN